MDKKANDSPHKELRTKWLPGVVPGSRFSIDPGGRFSASREPDPKLYGVRPADRCACPARFGSLP